MRVVEFLPEVQKVLEERGEPGYRLGQAYGALTVSLVRDWDEATSLPKGLREALNEAAPAAVLDLRNASMATDGTRKYLFYTHDGHAIETVMIPERGRHTVCISTQVGCPMACKFCATGLMGIKRNLKAREIAEQVLVAARDIAPERVSNVVVMGMGEPMLNYNETVKALRVLNDGDGFNLAARHIAVSTLLAGVNDQPRHVEALADLLDHPLYHLNLLRFNWTDTGFSATSKGDAKSFLRYARELGLSATLRPSRGQDIDAACGQLAAKDLRGRPAISMLSRP